MQYKGSCHCGQVAFTVEGIIDGAMSCNCSICQRKGSLLWFVPYEQLHLLTPAQNSRAYVFNKQVIKHVFCPNCGMHPYGEGIGPDGSHMAAINLRCIEDIDLESVPVQTFNGRAI